MRCGVQLCLRSYTLPVGRCSAWSDLRGAGELPGQTECASVASPAVDEKLSGTDGRKGGRMGEKAKKEKKREGEMEGGSNLRVQQHHEQGGEEQKVAGRVENYDPPTPSFGDLDRRRLDPQPSPRNP